LLAESFITNLVMSLISCEEESQFSKCIPFYIVGAILVAIGVPLMIAGIIGGFQFSDLLGYFGGTAVFIGILLLLIWYVITIPNLEKMKKALADSENKTKTSQKKFVEGRNNPAYANDSNDPVILRSVSKLAEHRQSFSSNSEKDSSSNAISPVEDSNPGFASETESTVLLIDPYTELDGAKTKLEDISECAETSTDPHDLQTETKQTAEAKQHTNVDMQQSNNSNNRILLQNEIFSSKLQRQRTSQTPEVSIASVSCTSVLHTNPLTSSYTW